MTNTPPCIRVYIRGPKNKKALTNRDASRFANQDIPKQPKGRIELTQRAKNAGIERIEVDENAKNAKSILVNIFIIAYAAQEGIILIDALNDLIRDKNKPNITNTNLKIIDLTQEGVQENAPIEQETPAAPVKAEPAAPAETGKPEKPVETLSVKPKKYHRTRGEKAGILGIGAGIGLSITAIAIFGLSSAPITLIPIALIIATIAVGIPTFSSIKINKDEFYGRGISFPENNLMSKEEKITVKEKLMEMGFATGIETFKKDGRTRISEKDERAIQDLFSSETQIIFLNYIVRLNNDVVFYTFNSVDCLILRVKD